MVLIPCLNMKTFSFCINILCVLVQMKNGWIIEWKTIHLSDNKLFMYNEYKCPINPKWLKISTFFWSPVFLNVIRILQTMKTNTMKKEVSRWKKLMAKKFKTKCNTTKTREKKRKSNENKHTKKEVSNQGSRNKVWMKKYVYKITNVLSAQL